MNPAVFDVALLALVLVVIAGCLSRARDLGERAARRRRRERAL